MCTIRSINITSVCSDDRLAIKARYKIILLQKEKHKTYVEFNCHSMEIKRRTGVIIIVYYYYIV